MATPGVLNWQAQILHAVGAPVTPANLTFLNAWARAEGGSASNNPFNTTQQAPGASSYNSVGVRNYTSPQQGIQATVQTLQNGRYGNILAALHQGTNARAAAAALANSPWGTGSLVEKILGAGAVSAPTAPSPSAPPISAPTPSRPRLDPNILALFNQGNQMFGLPALPGSLAQSSAPPVRQPTAGSPSTPSTAAAPPTQTKAPKIKGPTLRYIEHFAAPFGLTITSTTGGKHAKNSYHYRGRAVDFGGQPQNMAALADYALKHANQFQEMFYTGPGHPDFFISQGKVLPLSQLDKSLYLEHENHVHLAR